MIYHGMGGTKSKIIWFFRPSTRTSNSCERLGRRARRRTKSSPSTTPSWSSARRRSARRPRTSWPPAASRQCCGSESGSTGSTCFWASWIQIHQFEVWIRIWILLSPTIKSKKNLDSFCVVTSFDFLSLKMMYKYLQKSNKQKNL